VTDFGLAKTGDSAMTHTGDILGTVRYMSPERFRGQCDVRADVYALGMTLYEMLTLKAAFASGDRLKLIELIRETEAASPRSIDAWIPRDLETIVMKAIDKDAKRRYQSADEMGEDLQRFVNDEPIKARRVGQVERFTRWCRHHPAVATLMMLVLLLMAVGTTVSTWQAVVATRARAQLAAKNDELAAEQAKVQARFDTAIKAIETFHTGVSEDALLKNAEFKELRKKLLEEAARFYDDLKRLVAGQTDVKSRKTLAMGYFQLGELTDKIGDKKVALAAHQKALALRRELAVEGADVETRLDVARSLFAAGTLLRSTGDPAGALSAFQEQRDLAAALEAESPTGAVWAQLAFAHNGIGFVLDDTGKGVEALDAFRKALAIYQKLPESGQYQDPGQGPKFGRQLQAGTHMSIGVVLALAGKQAEGLESFRKASDIMQKLADANPANPSVQAYLADSYVNLGAVLIDTGKPEQALEPFRKALAIRKKLVDVSPAVTEFRLGLGWSHFTLGAALLNTGKPAEAQVAYRKALAIFQKLVNDQPAVTALQGDLAGIHNDIGVVLCEYGEASGGDGSVPRGTGHRAEPGGRRPWEPQLEGEPGLVLQQHRPGAGPPEATGRGVHRSRRGPDGSPEVGRVGTQQHPLQMVSRLESRLPRRCPGPRRAAGRSRRRPAAGTRPVGQAPIPGHRDTGRTSTGAGESGRAGRGREVRGDEGRGEGVRRPVRRRPRGRRQDRLGIAQRAEGARLRRPPRPGGLPESRR
jgi:eukaryotic-like serine/threonine-protein kinase